jgi:hypothetical protein
MKVLADIVSRFPRSARGRLLLGCLLLWSGRAAAAQFADSFADRETVTGPTGDILGDNLTATFENGEPRHGGKPGGHSVWISWVAPANGAVTFRTAGSTFDTLLSAYTLSSTNDTTVDKLHETARNDDAPGAEPTSLILFGARAGVRYEIAVDGFAGAEGSIRLHWDFVDLTTPPPVIVSVPGDRAARLGDPVTLSVQLESGPDVDLQWRFNDQSFDATGPTLFIASLQVTNVGRYTLRIRVGKGGDRLEIDTTPVELQINSDGQTNALARDKFFDSLGTPLIGENEVEANSAIPSGRRNVVQSSIRTQTDGPVGVVRGYNGSQIFNTVYATVDPTEPAHCGIAGGASYWLAYQPPADGTLTLDTGGSTYDTVVEVFTHNGAPASYADLIPINCDHGSLSNGLASGVTLPVVKNRAYLVAVDGVAGARGIAWLNYQLNTNEAPKAPTLLSLPVRRVVAVGSDVSLTPPIVASPPWTASWSFGGSVLSGANNSTLVLSEITRDQAGDYVFTISNYLGAPITVTLPLSVVVPPRVELRSAVSASALSFETVAGQSYFIQQAEAVTGPWTESPEPVLGDGQPASLPLPAGTNQFLRLRVE